MTLADVKFVRTGGDAECGRAKLYLFGAKAANLKITDEENPYKGKSATFMYMDEAEAEEVRKEEGYEYVVAGWYHEDDEDYENPMDNYPLPYGLGYSVVAFDAGYSLLWNGEVVADANMPAIQLNKNDFVWSGNAAPKKMTLADFSFVRTKGDAECGRAKLYLFGAKAANLKITDEKNPYKGKSATFMYMDEAEAEEVRKEEGYEYVVAGWYHEDDEDYENPMGTYPVDPALGFALVAFDADYEFQLPGAL